MIMNKKKQLDVLEALTEALGNSEGQSVEEIREGLRDDGVDVDNVMKRLGSAREAISMAARRSVLETARERRLKLAERGREIIGRFQGWTREQIRSRIEEVGGMKAGFAYRDLESMGIEEMAALLEDLEMTKARANEEDPNEE
jgi:DNA-binding MarR family transcriptional regulator